MTTEPVDLKKAVTAPFTGVYWVKTIMYGLGLLALFLIGSAVKDKFFSKPKPSQAVTVQSGGVATIINEANKRHLILFAEPYVFAEGGNDSRTGVGVKCGLRWEF